MDPYVIVGAGLAGAKAAETLRAEGFDGPVVLLGDEDELPYERPPLSKGYLLGKEERESARVHPPSGTPSTTSSCGSAPRSPRSTRPSTRSSWPAASGCGTRSCCWPPARWCAPLPVPGGDTVLTLRRLPDADRMRAAFRPAPGWSWSAPAGSGWRRPRPPASTAPR